MNDDCIYHIFTKLDVNDIINCSLVSKRLYKISNIEMLWYLLFKKKFYNVKCTVINGKKFYDNYKKYSILNNFLLKNGQENVNIITRDLSIVFKQLQTIPKELGQLASLQILYLYNNKLQTIPKELGQLASLQTLNLSNNQLQTIPKELGQLASLQILNLDNNQLQTIPKELGQLASLQRLYLDNNQLQTIPKELGQLASLQELYLHNNQLQTIPKELGQLAMLQHFYLDNNLKNLIFLDNGIDIDYV